MPVDVLGEGIGQRDFFAWYPAKDDFEAAPRGRLEDGEEGLKELEVARLSATVWLPPFLKMARAACESLMISRSLSRRRPPCRPATTFTACA